MNPNEYEAIVEDICIQLSSEDAIVNRHIKIHGKSGQDHEIDVSVEFKYMKVKFLVLVECKYWNKPVGLNEVMVLAGRLDDIGAHKGILVTKKGFQKGAYNIAHSKGIALILCRERQHFDIVRERVSNTPSSDHNDSNICNIYEHSYSYYQAVSNQNATHSAFPLLIKQILKLE